MANDGAVAGGAPEPALYIRQGANVQGPFVMSRVHRYVRQGRVRRDMLFSPDGVWWADGDHITGVFAEPSLSPEGAPPPAASMAKPPLAQSVPGAEEPVREVGSSTLVGYTLSPSDLAGGGDLGLEEPVVRRRPRRFARTKSQGVSGDEAKAAIALVGLLVVGGIAVMASKGGSEDADFSGTSPSRSVGSTPPLRESKEAFRARWERVHQVPDGKVFTALKGVIWLTDAAAVKAKIESVSGRKPDRTQTIGGRNYWYFECADGPIQLVWWQDGIFNYTVNDH